MKKAFIGALIGGIIIFIWQFLSWAVLDLHYPAQQYTDKQDAIMSTLSSQQLPEGGYFLPRLPKDASSEQQEQWSNEMQGKPWVSIQYHNSFDANMGLNMVRGYLVDVVVVLLLCWMLLRFEALNFTRVLTASIFTGVTVYLNSHYTGHIWYQFFDTTAHLIDAVVSWGLCGVWLGWWLNRHKPKLSSIHVDERAKSMAD